MTIQCYINFQGNCRQAVDFYSRVFDTPAQIMTYGEMPHSPEFPVSDELKNQVLHASITLDGNELMFSDVPPEMPFCPGNNITLTLNGEDPDTLTQWFQKLSENGKVEMPLEATFWSELYGSVVDQFGVGWQINLKRK
ncbi:VOC family protein [[Clostridium] symbiosum]|uniref:VOC family protein n=1 Tax=Clostridium symbiosum TaxID=1512 RepID=UPI001D07BA54|nr:VOC family protein [[Clostridium] symbiosum]MCB6608342.1 VOC family protein [[Clostridium] symbiosum]MCB6932892.1 VOC family protein [[Clostridium] symbiosum]